MGKHFRAVGTRVDCKALTELTQSVNLKYLSLTMVGTHLKK